MILNRIPNTDLHVSSLCLGTMTFGTPVTEKEAESITRHAISSGINFIDTADIYEGYTRYIGSPGGIAETYLGKALRGLRNQVVLASKVGMKVGSEETDQGLGRKHVMEMIDISLGRLQTDYLDLYYMHKPDEITPLEESIETFNDLITAGKIRHWAISNFNAEQLSLLLAVCDQNHWIRPVAIQPAYSLLKKDVEKDLLPLCKKEDIAVVPYQVLQGGLLTGKYKKGEPVPAGSRQLEKPEWTLDLSDIVYDQLLILEIEAKQKRLSLIEYALRYLLKQDGVVSLVVGVKTKAQLDSLITALAR